jgi:hypothetical protein
VVDLEKYAAVQRYVAVVGDTHRTQMATLKERHRAQIARRGEYHALELARVKERYEADLASLKAEIADRPVSTGDLGAGRARPFYPDASAGSR